jgi:uncharacterized membrane protein YidH (DUF202 family)
MPDEQTAKPSNTELALDRTGMARFRTQLALDRTTLAWIRTTLTMGTFGFGTIGFFRTLREKSPTPIAIHLQESAVRFGVALVVLSIGATVVAALSHVSTLRRLSRNETPVVSEWSVSATVALLLAVIGLASLWFVLSDVPIGGQ